MQINDVAEMRATPIRTGHSRKINSIARNIGTESRPGPSIHLGLMRVAIIRLRAVDHTSRWRFYKSHWQKMYEMKVFSLFSVF